MTKKVFILIFIFITYKIISCDPAHLAELVAKMVDILTPDAEGAPKRFQNSSVEKLTGFMEMFGQRNVTQDEELSELIEAAKDLLDGVEAQELRDEEELRTAICDGMKEVASNLAELVEDGPTRALLGAEDE